MLQNCSIKSTTPSPGTKSQFVTAKPASPGPLPVYSLPKYIYGPVRCAVLFSPRLLGSVTNQLLSVSSNLHSALSRTLIRDSMPTLCLKGRHIKEKYFEFVSVLLIYLMSLLLYNEKWKSPPVP